MGRCVRAGEGVRVDDARWARAATPRLATTARDARDALARTAACVRGGDGSEAMFGRDDFDGARDARVAIEGARRGTTLSGTSLGELGSTGRQRRLGEKLAARRGGKEALREIEEALQATPRAHGCDRTMRGGAGRGSVG